MDVYRSDLAVCTPNIISRSVMILSNLKWKKSDKVVILSNVSATYRETLCETFGSCDRASRAKYEERKTNKMQ